MLGRRSFKSDDSFLEKLTIGAVGTRAVFDDLQRQKHEPIELERGSMSYKIWKTIKIKRLRVPDPLCLKCSARTEARAKTKLELSMSHSMADPARGWDRGLTDRDMVAFSLVRKIREGPTDWEAVNPFDGFTVGQRRLADIVRTHDPPYWDSKDVYNHIAENIEDWVDEAISIREGLN
jgi:hypothetical protein